MRTKTLMVSLLFTVGIGAGVVGWREAGRQREVGWARAQGVREQVELREEVRRAEARLKAAGQEQERLRRMVREEQAAVWAIALAPRGADELTRQVRKDPALQALKLAAERAKNVVKYGPLFRRLGLTPEQSEGFLASVARRKEQDADCDAAVQSLGLAEGDEAIARLRGKAAKEAEAEQRAGLGDEGYRQAKDYETTLMLRGTVAAFASSAVMAGLSLTTQQAEEMTRIVVGASERRKPEGWVVLNSTDWDAVDARACGVLTPKQFALFQAIEPHAALDGMGSRFSARLERLSDRAREADMRAAPEVASGANGAGGAKE